MKRISVGKKRPCRICKRWFMPDARVKDRQMTCGGQECKRQWHRRKCAQWNRANGEYFKANYLQKKLDAVTAPVRSQPGEGHGNARGGSRLNTGLPLEKVQEVIGLQALIIIEYFGQLLYRRFQELIKGQVVENTKESTQQPAMECSR
jgi:hypothetical protein